MKSKKNQPKKTSLKLENSNTNFKEFFIKNVESGYVYQVVPHLKEPDACLLRTGNKFVKFKLLDIKNGLVNGKWTDPNIHEIKKFKEKDQMYLESLNLIFLNRIIHSEILIEIDNALKEHFLDDKYMVSCLEKTEKQITRVMKDNFYKAYSADKDIFFHVLNTAERVGKKLAKIKPHEFIYLEKYLDKFIEDPSKFAIESIEITKVHE